MSKTVKNKPKRAPKRATAGRRNYRAELEALEAEHKELGSKVGFFTQKLVDYLTVRSKLDLSQSWIGRNIFDKRLAENIEMEEDSLNKLFNYALQLELIKIDNSGTNTDPDTTSE